MSRSHKKTKLSNYYFVAKVNKENAWKTNITKKNIFTHPSVNEKKTRFKNLYYIIHQFVNEKIHALIINIYNTNYNLQAKKTLKYGMYNKPK